MKLRITRTFKKFGAVMYFWMKLIIKQFIPQLGKCILFIEDTVTKINKKGFKSTITLRFPELKPRLVILYNFTIYLFTNKQNKTPVKYLQYFTDYPALGLGCMRDYNLCFKFILIISPNRSKSVIKAPC